MKDKTSGVTRICCKEGKAGY